MTSIANVVPAFGFIGIPVIGWLLDRMGYGITLATINFLGVLASFFQAMPNVWFQVRPCLDPVLAAPLRVLHVCLLGIGFLGIPAAFSPVMTSIWVRVETCAMPVSPERPLTAVIRSLLMRGCEPPENGHIMIM